MKQILLTIALIAATGLTNLATAQTKNINKEEIILGDINKTPNPHRKLIPPILPPNPTFENKQGSSHQTGHYSSGNSSTSNSQQNQNRSGNNNQNSGLSNRDNKNNAHR